MKSSNSFNQTFNQTLMASLNILGSFLKNTQHPTLRTAEKEVHLFSGDNTLVTVSDQDIKVAGISFQEKLRPDHGSGREPFRETQWENFLKDISSSIVRINHLGISYFSTNINEEVERIKSLLEKTSFRLYTE